MTLDTSKSFVCFLGEGWERSSEFEAPHLGNKLLLASSNPIGSSMSMFELYTGVASHASMNMFNALFLATPSMYQCSVCVTHASLSNVNSHTYNHLQFQPLLDDLMRKLVAVLQICTSFDACVLCFVWVASLPTFFTTTFCGLQHPLRKQLEESFAKAGLHRILACQTCSWLFVGCMGYSSILLTWEKQRKSESHDHPLDLLERWWSLRTACEENLWQSRPWTAWIHDGIPSAKMWIFKLAENAMEFLRPAIPIGTKNAGFGSLSDLNGFRLLDAGWKGRKSFRRHPKTPLTIQIKYVSAICTGMPSKKSAWKSKMHEESWPVSGVFPGGLPLPLECLTHKAACQTFENGCKIYGNSNMGCPVNNCPGKEGSVDRARNKHKHVDDEHKLIKTERKRKGKKGKKELTEKKTKEKPSRKRFWE